LEAAILFFHESVTAHWVKLVFGVNSSRLKRITKVANLIIYEMVVERSVYRSVIVHLNRVCLTDYQGI